MADVSVEIYVEKLANLIHNEANPRYIKGKKHRELVQSLQEFPEMKDLREIVIDENNLILAGDKRCYALEELDYSEVRVKKVFGLSEAKKRRFIIVDNHHSGEWDTDILANQWDMDELKAWNMPDFKTPGELKAPKEEKQYQKHDVTCPECGHHFSLDDSAE